MTFTIPADLRPIFEDRRDLIKAMPDSVYATIKRVMLKSAGQELIPALVSVIHPFGNDIVNSRMIFFDHLQKGFQNVTLMNKLE